MNAYYYLLYRIYKYYANKPKENSILLFSVTAFSTVVIYIGLFTIYLLLNYLGLAPMVTSKYYVIIIMLILGVINYYGFVKPKKYLQLNFKSDFKGGMV